MFEAQYTVIENEYKWEKELSIKAIYWLKNNSIIFTWQIKGEDLYLLCFQ